MRREDDRVAEAVGAGNMHHDVFILHLGLLVGSHAAEHVVQIQALDAVVAVPDGLGLVHRQNAAGGNEVLVRLVHALARHGQEDLVRVAALGEVRMHREAEGQFLLVIVVHGSRHVQARRVQRVADGQRAGKGIAFVEVVAFLDGDFRLADRAVLVSFQLRHGKRLVLHQAVQKHALAALVHVVFLALPDVGAVLDAVGRREQDRNAVGRAVLADIHRLHQDFPAFERPVVEVEARLRQNAHLVARARHRQNFKSTAFQGSLAYSKHGFCSPFLFC